MKNLKLAWKFGIGFGLLILIVCALGGLAIVNMSSVRTQSTKISEEYIPEVAVANNLERSSREAIFEMRGFGFTSEEAYLASANKHLEDVHKYLAEAQALADKHPSLVKLRDNLTVAKAKAAEYERLVVETANKDKAMDELRLTMDKMASEFTKDNDTYIAGQTAKVKKDIESGASANILEQDIDKISMGNTISELVNDVRIANFKFQALRDPKLLQAALKNFSEAEALFAKLKPITANPENLKMLEASRVSAEAYQKTVQNFLANWLALQDLSKKRVDTADQLLASTKATSTAGIEGSQHMADNANSSLGSASTIMIVGLLVAIALGVIVAWIITTGITKPVFKGVTFAQQVAGGDLSRTLDLDQKDEIGELAVALNAMVANLKTKIQEAEQKSIEAGQESQKAQAAMLEAKEAQEKAQAGERMILEAADKIQSVVEIVTSASEELSAQIEQSSRGAEEQASRVGETATAMEEMNATVLEVAKNASQAADTSDKAKHKAEEGSGVVRQVVIGINDVQKQALQLKEDMTILGQQAQGIGQIMNVISDIADQTNLLALNAAIEAARAGEAGRGFAVVADEVRKLAEKTMTATKEVGDAINGIQNGTQKNIGNVDQAVRMIDDATGLASKSGESLNEIVTLVDLTTDQVRSIATASEQQSAASEEINRSIEDVSRISSETSDAMRQSAQAVGDLANQAQVLKTLVDGMNSGDGSNSQGRHLPGRPQQQALDGGRTALPARI